MRPPNAPVGALPIPPPRGPFPTEQLEQIAGIHAQITLENAVDRGNFDAACAAWTTANLHSREMQLPLRAKPAPFIAQVFSTAPDTDPDSGVVWIWIDQGTPVECPDLPPIPAKPADSNIHIGKFLYGNYWRAGEDNRFSDTTQTVPGRSDDGIVGEWRFLASAMGNRGWYQRVG